MEQRTKRLERIRSNNVGGQIFKDRSRLLSNKPESLQEDAEEDRNTCPMTEANVTGHTHAVFSPNCSRR